MQQIIPLQKIPNQRLSIVLGGQNCIISLSLKGNYLYMGLECEGKVVRQGMICLCGINLLQYPTPYFTGTLYFGDVKGRQDVPTYAELGDRYILFYSEN